MRASHPASLTPHPSAAGVLNLDKPAGPTSHDVVARVRRLTGIRRVGHAGTLDPAATGVLIVLLGAATRLAEYPTDLPKQYKAQIRFGLRTDSQDTTGAILSQEDASLLTEAAARAALAPFRGEILQTPPMVSAVKVGGQRLYELARRGETVERAARPVTVYELELEEFHPGPAAWGRLAVTCSSGTYVRTLCADLGEALGCGAAMGELRRTAIGSFRVDDAVTLADLEQSIAQGRLSELLLPPVAAVAHLPAVTVGPAERQRLLHGMPVPASGGAGVRGAASPSPHDSSLIIHPSLVRVQDEQGELLAISRWETTGGGDEGRGMRDEENPSASSLIPHPSSLDGTVVPVKVLMGADAND